ncbi:MAG: helix-turn-helix domain-containing protein [Oscillospiraceae bacterium]|nr:helix-turn-helix domain-containing protein [Oscillospiraceae bacterium]
MEIGKKLRAARAKCGLTQEQAAERLYVTRQTVSNWENERSYPDIVSIVKISELYDVSLDELLKGDDEMMKHLEETTNAVKSSKRLFAAVILNNIVIIVMFAAAVFLPGRAYITACVFCMALVSTAFLVYEIVKKI